MKILSVKVLRGANYWSNYRKKLIEMKLDLETYEDYPTNKLPGFTERLKVLIPTLFSHRCSPGVEGGFFLRLEEGTWLGHVIEHIALELQTLAGMNCGFGRTFSAEKEGVYHVIFAYEVESAGLYAAEAAVKLVDCLAHEKEYTTLAEDIAALQTLSEQEKLGPSTRAIVDEAQKRKIPFTRFKDNSLIILGQGCYQKKIWATMSSQTSAIGVDLVADKDLTKQMLGLNLIPVPSGVILTSLDELEQTIRQLGFPLVIKPLDGNHGRGVSTDINTLERAILGFKFAQSIAKEVIVEKYIKGRDYRFLVINYQVVAVANRVPAMVVGTGMQSIQALIDEINRDPKRGIGHENTLTAIKIDEVTLSILNAKKYSLDTILPEGEVLYLKEAANLSSGGTAIDVTDEVHPYNIHLAERVARIVNLDICGIDVIAEDISIAINEDNGAIIEVNAAPGLRMHQSPNHGISRDMGTPILDMLYPAGSASRIPVVAVTGTNGKTTVVRLIAHIADYMSHHVGFTSTEGVYINRLLVHKGDCSGPQSAAVILQDSLVDFAVLECARGGILRSGLGFDQCDISVITNITSDHLGQNDIHSLEELVKVKAVVARSTTDAGYSILNAEDDLVFALKETLSCNIALFGMHENARIREHCHVGGLAAYIEDGFIIVKKGANKNSIAKVRDIPLTFSGTADFMIQNILPAVLAGVISGFSTENIVKALHGFHPSSENIPGRMNIFDFDHYKVMVDYAHNEASYLEIKKYLSTLDCTKKVGIIGATGDRRDEDIQKIGAYAALMFDEIIIRHDKDGRGKTNQQLTDLIMQGIRSSKLQPSMKIISDGFDAVQYAMSTAVPGTFIYYTVDDVLAAVEYMEAEELKYKLARHPSHETQREFTNYWWR
ncbi:MAG: cyanophycin synthetase [Legionellaceae bacterium]|nr:cyanophycin synthetase [Legionellaceae bacterium]